VHAVKVTARGALVHGGGTEAERLELPERHSSMLMLGQLGNHPIRLTTLHFPAYMAGFYNQLLHRPQRPSPGRATG